LIAYLIPVKFAFKNDPPKRENIRFIAKNVSDIISSSNRKSVRYLKIISVLTKEVKEQEKRIEDLESRIN